MEKEKNKKGVVIKKKGWFKSRYIRYISQLTFVASIVFLSWRHLGFATKLAGPIDTYCPFGAIETLPKLISSGEFVRRTADTNLVLFAGMILAIFVFGGAFCGWVCPMGTVFEWLYKLRSKIWKKRIELPTWLHKSLRWLRYAVLILILVMTVQANDLWFKAFDPYSIAFTWGHAANTIGLIILGVLLLAGLFVERFFCLYLCPLGGVIHPVAKASATGIVRNTESCIDCKICDKVCPYRIPVSQQTKIDRGSCITCLSCVDECPVPQTLEFKIGW